MIRLFLRASVFTVVCACVFAHASETASASYNLAQRFFNDQLYNLALEQYDKYLSMREDTEKDPLVHFKIALCHYKMGNSREAADRFEEYLRNYPADDNAMEATWLAAESQRSSEAYREASEWYQLYWKRYVGSAKAQNALFLAAQCAYKDSNTERAMELYTLYTRRFAKHATSKDAFLSLASLLIQSKQYPRAWEALADAQDQWGEDQDYQPRILYRKALLARRMQKNQKAAEFFSELLKYSNVEYPEKEEAFREYLTLLLEREDHEQALTVYESLATAVSSSGAEMQSPMLISWAETARKARQFEKAAALYERVLSRDQEAPQKNKAMYRLAECHAGQGDFSKAIETLRRLAEVDSAGEFGSRALLKMGDLYFANDLLSSTITVYRRYLRLPLGSQKDRVIFRIGSILQSNYRKYGAAIREYETILRHYASSQFYYPSLYAIAQCREAKEEYQAALRQYEHVAESCPDQDLADKAEKRADYLRNFHLLDAESAALALTEITEASMRGIPRGKLIWRLADIYESHLRRYDKALEIYESVLAMEPTPPDTIVARAMVLKGGVLEKLYAKGTMEEVQETASYMKEEAVKTYRAVLDSFQETEYTDDAAYALMMLNDPNVGEYEEFLRSYPGSSYAPRVLLSIARHYEKRARQVDKRFSGKAAEAYATFTAKCPNDSMLPYALTGLTRNLLAVGRADTAETVIGSFLSRFQESEHRAEVLSLQGKMLKIKGDHQGALIVYKELLTNYPFSSFANQARFEMAFAQLHTGQVLEALSNFKSYLQDFIDGEQSEQARFGLGICLARIGKTDQAVEVLKSSTAGELPASMKAQAHYELGRIAQASKDSYKAIDFYKKALSYEQFDRFLETSIRTADLYFSNSIYDEAAVAFDNAYKRAESRDDTLKALSGLVSSLIMDGKAKRADKKIRFLKETYEKDYPGVMAKVVFHEGLYLLNKKEYNKALNRFAYIVDKYSETEYVDDAAYHKGLAQFYAKQEDGALTEFKEFAVQYPQSDLVPEAKFKMAMVFHGQENHLQAAELFREVTKFETSDADLRFRAAHNAAISFQKISSWDDAADMYTYVGKAFPERTSPSALNIKIGFCMVQASKFQDALGYFNKANENPDPVDKPEIVYWIATCHSRLGEHQKAVSEYLKVPYLYADAGKWGVTAELEAARLYERMEEFDKARNLYKKIVQSDGERGRFGKQALSRLERLNNLAGTPN